MLDLKGWLGCGENREGYIPSSQQGFMGPLSIRVLRCKQQKLTLDDFLKKELMNWKKNRRCTEKQLNRKGQRG